MKSILEQNFDELYAQVEERVKCIKPVKQIDIYTKTLMWTSLNEILTDVFGGSRFMWMIESTDISFVVKFVDIYRVMLTNQLIVPYTIEIIWPSETELMSMSAEDLKKFKEYCSENELTYDKIGRHYQRNENWFSSLLHSRLRAKRSPINSTEFRDKLCCNTVNRWSDDELDNHLLMLQLKERSIPISKHIIASFVGERNASTYAATAKMASETVCRVLGTRYEKRQVYVLDKLIQYIERSIEYIHTTNHAFKRQTIVKLPNNEDKQKLLIQFFEDKKISIEIERRNIVKHCDLKMYSEST